MNRIMAINQHGVALHGLSGKFPRKDLLSRLGAHRAEKIFEDGPDGNPTHVGYIVHGSWWIFYTPIPWAGKVKS